MDLCELLAAFFPLPKLGWGRGGVVLSGEAEPSGTSAPTLIPPRLGGGKS